MKILGYCFILILFFSILGCCRGGDDDGVFAVCLNDAEIVDENTFETTSSADYTIQNIQVIDDCLYVTYETSICESNEIVQKLFSTNAFYDVYPLQREVRLVLLGTEECSEAHIGEASFNLEPFRMDGNSPLPLNIVGWSEQLQYYY